MNFFFCYLWPTSLLTYSSPLFVPISPCLLLIFVLNHFFFSLIHFFLLSHNLSHTSSTSPSYTHALLHSRRHSLIHSYTPSFTHALKALLKSSHVIYNAVLTHDIHFLEVMNPPSLLQFLPLFFPLLNNKLQLSLA